MAKRKKRVVPRHSEQFERLDEELTKALDNLSRHNRETEQSLGEFAPEDTGSSPDDDAQDAAGQEEEPPTA